ncbi:MAG: prepilin-type N-terminal cleavage/methylation domain-containing protein, partial [Bdellovibrionales bacterium]|nr:prepilin-type N-terminal cleavage/methylation domain-containing protein [Bdellovibrionales bacterium]
MLEQDSGKNAFKTEANSPALVGLGRLFILLNQRAYTLSELLMTVAISSIIFLGGSTLLVQVNEAILVSQQRQHMNDNLLTLNQALLRFMGQAIDMSWRGNANIDNLPIGPVGNSCFNATCGAIRQYSASAIGPTAVSDWSAPSPVPNVDTLALFIKESRHSSATNPNELYSQLSAVGIFYQPQLTQHSGVIWISEVGPGNNQPLRAAMPGSLSFENVVDVQIMNPSPSNAALGTKLRGIDILVRMRAYSKSDRSTWRFCPPAQAAVANCVT